MGHNMAAQSINHSATTQAPRLSYIALEGMARHYSGTVMAQRRKLAAARSIFAEIAKMTDNPEVARLAAVGVGKLA